MLQFFNNVSLILIIWSLIFIFAQHELMHIIFSLILFTISSLGWLSIRSLEFIILVLFIIYIGVITVLFLFITIIYNLPNLIINKSYKNIIIVVLVGGILTPMLPHNIIIYEGIDIFYFISFFNNYFHAILLCSLLLLISIISSLIIVNILYIAHYK